MTLNVRNVPDELVKKAKMIALQSNLSLREVIIEAIAKYVETKKK